LSPITQLTFCVCFLLLCCSCLLCFSCNNCCLCWSACDQKDNCNSWKSINNHLHTGFDNFCERNQPRCSNLLFISRFRGNPVIHVFFLPYKKRQDANIHYDYFAAGGVGIANMVEKLENDEYMGFENLCYQS